MPNVLVLISDQHSKHHLGCYGDEGDRAPFFEQDNGGGNL